MRCLLSEAIVLLSSSLWHEANMQAVCWMLSPVTQSCPGTAGAEQRPPASPRSRAGSAAAAPRTNTAWRPGQRCVGETNPHRTETAPRDSTSSPPRASPPSLAFWKVSFGEHAQSICHGRESQVPSGTAEQQVRPPCEVLSWYSLALGRLQSTPRLHRDYTQQFIYSPK